MKFLSIADDYYTLWMVRGKWYMLLVSRFALHNLYITCTSRLVEMDRLYIDVFGNVVKFCKRVGFFRFRKMNFSSIIIVKVYFGFQKMNISSIIIVNCIFVKELDLFDFKRWIFRYYNLSVLKFNEKFKLT